MLSTPHQGTPVEYCAPAKIERGHSRDFYVPRDGGIRKTRANFAEQAATVNMVTQAVPTRPPANTSEPIQTADRKKDPTNQERGVIKGKDRKANTRVENNPIPANAEIAHRADVSRRKIMSVVSQQRSPRRSGESQQVDEGYPKHNSKPTRAHTKNLLTRKIVRALDERNFEGVADEPPTQEELMKTTSGQVREIFKRVFEKGDPMLEAALSRSSRARGHKVRGDELDELRPLLNKNNGYETHRTMTRRLIRVALRKVDEERSREKEGRGQTRRLKREARDTQFLAVERFEEQLTKEAFLQREQREEATLSALYPEAHDPKIQPDDPDNLLGRYPEARDRDEYFRRMKVKESREAVLSVLAQHEEGAALVEKIPSSAGEGNGDGKTYKGNPIDRRSLASLKRAIPLDDRYYEEHPAPTSEDYFTQEELERMKALKEFRENGGGEEIIPAELATPEVINNPSIPEIQLQ